MSVILKSISVFLVAIISLVSVLLAFEPVRALTNPSSMAILDQKVFRNLKATGDQLYFCRYNVVYSPQPSEAASSTFQFAIYDTTGTILLYSTDLHYYQENIISIYLSPSQALTWTGAYKIRVMGKPGIFFSVVEGVNMATRVLDPTGDYKEASDCQAYLLTVATTLQTDWGITLLTGDKLNSTGTTTFITAIPGLMDIYPSFFVSVTSQPTITYKNWTEIYSKSDSHAGETLRNSMKEIGRVFFGIDEGPSVWMFTAFGGVLLGSIFYAVTGSSAMALIGMFLAVPVSAVMGLHGDMFRFLALLITVMAILFGITFIIARFA